MDTKTAELATELADRYGDEAAQLAFDMAIDAKRRGDTGMAMRLAEVAAALAAPLSPTSGGERSRERG